MRENQIVYFRGRAFWVMGEVDRLPYAELSNYSTIDTLLTKEGPITNIVGVPTEYDMVVDHRTLKNFAISSDSKLPIWEVQAI